MKQTELVPAVILGMTATGLSVARSLGRKHIPVIGLDKNKNNAGMHSRYCKSLVCPDAVNKEKEFVEYLIKVGQIESTKSILFIAADEYLVAVSNNREALSNYFKFNIPSKEIVDAFINKIESYKIAVKYGLLCPKTYCINNENDLICYSNKMNYPCVLKPTLSHLWHRIHSAIKVIVVNSPEEAKAAYI